MTKQYLPRALFEGMTCSAAQLHVLGKASIDQMAQTYWDSYKNTYIDDDVVQDIIRAANDGINLLTRAGATQLDSFFHHLKWYCTCFGQDGRYIRRGFFDGTFFQKSESQDIDRVTHFLDKLKRYYVGLTAGLRWYPPAPDGWSLQTRKMWNSEVKWLTDFTIPSNPDEANPAPFPLAPPQATSVTDSAPLPSTATQSTPPPSEDPTLREMLLEDFDHDLPIAGGFGGSKDDPIVLLPEAGPDYVRIEYLVLRCLGIARNVEWKTTQQALMTYQGKQIDQIKIETKETTDTEIITTTTNYYFDVSSCIGRYPIP